MNDPGVMALQQLPHGPGFRFVDSVSSLEPGVCGTGEYRVRADEAFFPAHFPGNPLFPGVLLLEACAQLAGVVAQSDPHQTAIPELRLAAIRGAKLLGTARPGEVVTLHARIVRRLDRFIVAQATATVRGSLVAQCELTLAGSQELKASEEAPALL